MGFTPDKKGSVFVTATAAGYDKAITRRTGEMALDSDGNLNGATMVKFEGGDTLEHQLDEMETDEAGRYWTLWTHAGSKQSE